MSFWFLYVQLCTAKMLTFQHLGFDERKKSVGSSPTMPFAEPETALASTINPGLEENLGCEIFSRPGAS